MSPILLGRSLRGARAAGAHAVSFEISAEGVPSLWLDVARPTAGIYLIERHDLRRLSRESEASGRTRHALLLLRKELEGCRISSLRRVAGQRSLLLRAGSADLVLRFSGAPAVTLALGGAPVATFGEGREAWPAPGPDVEREASWPTREGGRPSLRLPAPLESCHDADLAAPHALALAPREDAPPGLVVPCATWRDAAARYLEAQLRGSRFERQRSIVASWARKESRRLARLERHLEADRAGLPASLALRRAAEALLAVPQGLHVAHGDAEVETEIPDPYAPGHVVRVFLNPRLSLAANADRLFEKARRIERGRDQIEARLGQTREALALAKDRESRAASALDLSDLEPPSPDRPTSVAGPASGPRHYLTSHGLSILVGRGAKENHRLTFAVARPEDLWLHARDVPGAHVILRDNEGRAGALDRREAAEVAAFFSDARPDTSIDVHVTRRKHVRAARGGPGRVSVAYSETLRVVPRDPEGRLRRR